MEKATFLSGDKALSSPTSCTINLLGSDHPLHTTCLIDRPGNTPFSFCSHPDPSAPAFISAVPGRTCRGDAGSDFAGRHRLLPERMSPPRVEIPVSVHTSSVLLPSRPGRVLHSFLLFLVGDARERHRERFHMPPPVAAEENAAAARRYSGECPPRVHLLFSFPIPPPPPPPPPVVNSVTNPSFFLATAVQSLKLRRHLHRSLIFAGFIFWRG
jgi:hypothetical protein